MLKLVKSWGLGTLSVKIDGVIDESVDLRALLPERPETLALNCKGVRRINSSGVRNWMLTFGGFQKKGTHLVFDELPSVLVERLTLIPGFLCGGHFSSVHLPYRCNHCATELNQRRSVSQLKLTRPRISQVQCPKCQSAAEFDEVPSKFFAFLDEASGLARLEISPNKTE
jgi:hypothetical protein